MWRQREIKSAQLLFNSSNNWLILVNDYFTVSPLQQRKPIRRQHKKLIVCTHFNRLFTPMIIQCSGWISFFF
jgi:hypothetical protein